MATKLTIVQAEAGEAPHREVDATTGAVTFVVEPSVFEQIALGSRTETKSHKGGQTITKGEGGPFRSRTTWDFPAPRPQVIDAEGQVGDDTRAFYLCGQITDLAAAGNPYAKALADMPDFGEPPDARMIELFLLIEAFMSRPSLSLQGRRKGSVKTDAFTEHQSRIAEQAIREADNAVRENGDVQSARRDGTYAKKRLEQEFRANGKRRKAWLNPKYAQSRGENATLAVDDDSNPITVAGWPSFAKALGRVKKEMKKLRVN
ncbi:MAG: hypothetical protein NW206_02920 [Hyphomonadaceae bacterium]|nr:hypothetical protein [Hyphomonadaceae bacterium]